MDLRRAIGDVWGADNVPERGDRFSPHVSLAYSNGVASIGELDLLLTRNDLAEIEIPDVVSAISLIELDRDNARYEWREIAKVPLGPHRI
ncbi:hypothetical protein [Nocardia mexicana]|uniref:2'-5' RNA ligase superfamily protein n=1 Tax=Nocardia mexicana TaxID=279262 RepID=A0A370GLB3_9NOCA|nr:hypothetical protein [Nocardia mexicana]RDI44515.1 hypothetical protein DFR68_117132 [Nocardia mexicana]